MASFASAMAEARADLFAQVGTLATFTPATGFAVSLYVVFREGLQRYPDDFAATVNEQIKTIRYDFSDIGREANSGESFMIDGVSYACKFVVNNDGKTVTMAVRE